MARTCPLCHYSKHLRASGLQLQDSSGERDDLDWGNFNGFKSPATPNSWADMNGFGQTFLFSELNQNSILGKGKALKPCRFKALAEKERLELSRRLPDLRP